MGWPPKVGEVLPRAEEAWCVEEKWTDWILAERGHGSEWSRVFHVDPGEWEGVWETIEEAVRDAPIQAARDLGDEGISCAVPVELSVEGRTAAVTSAWHYSHEGAAPRLVTAYPTPYNQGHGSSA